MVDKPKIEYSSHAQDVLAERKIPAEWVEYTLSNPSRTETMADGTVHYLKPIEAHRGRFLRVVVNEARQPRRIVTVFFDRRLGREE